MPDTELEPASGRRSKLVVARDFLVDTRAEMDKVSWPSKDELYQATKAVLQSSLLLGVVIGVVDFLLQKILIDLVGKLAG